MKKKKKKKSPFPWKARIYRPDMHAGRYGNAAIDLNLGEKNSVLIGRGQT
jgi:hypothetical protein